MSKFRANIVIIILSFVLGFMILNIIGELRENKVGQQKKETIIETKEEVKDMTEIVKRLESEIHKTNKLLVLEGTCKSDVTYSDKDITENTNENFKWIRNKFSEWKSRELKVSATYNFGFTYNMENIWITTEGNDIIVNLSKNDINLEYVELVNTDSLYTESIGWLSKGDFTPQEINVLQERTYIATFNTIQSKSEYRDKAINTTIGNIEDTCNKLDIKAKCRYDSMDVAEQNQAEIHK